MRRLKQLEQENGRLKKLVAERDLEIESMKEIAAKIGERAGPSSAGGLRDAPRTVAAPVMRAVGSGAVGTGLALGVGGDGAYRTTCRWSVLVRHRSATCGRNCRVRALMGGPALGA